MLPFLIDDRGKLWDPHSLVLRAQLHASVGTQELRDFAVLNLGFIALAIGKASFHIQLRPALAQPAALGALYLALHKHGRTGAGRRRLMAIPPSAAHPQ